MANLWEVNEALENAMNYYVDEDGVVLDSDELKSKVDELEMVLSDKMENIGVWLVNIDSDIAEFEEASRKLSKRKKTLENKKAWLSSYLDRFIKAQYTNEDGIVDTVGLSKFKITSPRVTIKFGKSKSVEITDLSKVPSEYIKERKITDKDVMKTEIKEFITSHTDKDGNLDIEIDYAKLNENINLQVK